MVPNIMFSAVSHSRSEMVSTFISSFSSSPISIRFPLLGFDDRTPLATLLSALVITLAWILTWP